MPVFVLVWLCSILESVTSDSQSLSKATAIFPGQPLTPQPKPVEKPLYQFLALPRCSPSYTSCCNKVISAKQKQYDGSSLSKTLQRTSLFSRERFLIIHTKPYKDNHLNRNVHLPLFSSAKSHWPPSIYSQWLTISFFHRIYKCSSIAWNICLSLPLLPKTSIRGSDCSSGTSALGKLLLAFTLMS